MFNKGLEKDEKQEGLLKRLKNIKDKTDDQLKENKDNQLDIKSIGYIVKEELSQEAKTILQKLNDQEKFINYKKLNLKGGNNSEYNFSDYMPLKEFFKAIYYGKITIEEAEAIQEEFDCVYGALEKYKPKKELYIEKRGKLLLNAKKIYKGREMIIDAFKNEIFPMTPTGFSEDDEETPRDEDKEEKKDDRLPTVKEEEALEKVAAVDDILEPGLVEKYFKNDSLTDMLEQLKNLAKNQSKISAKKIQMFRKIKKRYEKYVRK